MKYFIPTYDQCRQICDANDNFNFYETKHVIDGYNVSIFNYRLAMPPIFYRPIPNSDITAHELRGLTFVFNTNGSLYKYFLLMDKFFNLNQHECSTYSLLKDQPIKNITYKEDGSITSFIQLPNGKVVGRSKASFESYQASEACLIYSENKSISKLVDWCFNNDLIAIFEYVSPKNRVVLQYTKTELVLIKVRNNSTGEYFDIENIPASILEGVSIVEYFDNLTLEDLIAKCETDIGYEGFVVTFQNNKMIKLKLLDYCAKHNLHTEDLHREDAIIYLIVENQIDDILCQLDKDDERRQTILDISDLVTFHLNRKFLETEQLLSNFKGNVKEFVLANRSNTNFASAMRVINQGSDLLSVIKERLLKDTFYLMNAREWIKNEKLLKEK